MGHFSEALYRWSEIVLLLSCNFLIISMSYNCFMLLHTTNMSIMLY